MGFYLQLKLLLWKNFTVKKRKPIVLLFELFIPLVLFFILIAIRKEQPAHPVKSRTFPVWPLPSAGVISVMQAFCDRGPVDENGFYVYPNATVPEFLTQLNSVAENNNFFRPGFTLNELGEIPCIYRSIIEDPVALHNKFQKARAVQVKEFLDNPDDMKQHLVQNLSLPEDGLDALLNSSVDMKELYKLIFSADRAVDEMHQSERDGQRQKRSSSIAHQRKLLPPSSEYAVHRNPDNFGEQYKSKLPFSGLLYSFFNNTHDDSLIKLLNWGLSPRNDTDKHFLSPEEAVYIIETIIFTPSTLRKIACSNSSFPPILSYLQGEQVHNLQSKFCTLNDEQMDFFKEEVMAHINNSRIVQILDLRSWNVTESHMKVKKLAMDLHKFHVFRKTLSALSTLAESLPQDACQQPNITEAMNGTDENAQVPSEQEKEKKDSQANEHYPQYGLLRIWKAMQKTVCGKEILDPDRSAASLEEVSLEDLGISKYQKDQIGILVHVLYSNPKILYAPNNTDADRIIYKANETFKLLDMVSQYAVKILNVSEEIRSFLSENTTDQDLETLHMIQEQIRRLPKSLELTNDQYIKAFVEEMDIPDKETFLGELATISNAACSWISLLSGLSLNVFHGFKDEKNLVHYFKHKAYQDNVTVLASVIFQMQKNGKMPNHMIYKIRQNASFTASNLVRSRFWFPGPRPWGYYYYQFGFVWIQDILERAMISLYAGKDISGPGSYIHQFPYPCYMEDQFLFMIKHVMPLCLTVSWVYSVSMLVQRIVYEKEQRLKEVMKMMGLANGVHWVAWFITSFLQMSVKVIILTIILKYGKVLTYSNMWIIFGVLETFAVSIIMFSFLVSVLYSKAKLAAACAGIIYFLSYVPYMYIAVREESAHDVIPVWVKSLASLLAPTAFGLGAKYFAFYEEIGVGAQWSNMAVSPVEDDAYNLWDVTMMLIVDAFVYAGLVWYIENVHPGAYGLPKPWYFPFTKSYWYGSSSAEEECISLLTILKKLWKKKGFIHFTEEDQACAMEYPSGNEYLFESDPDHLPLGVCIDGLSKKYKNSNKYAVNKLTINLYEGQITSLLGHNGAGKTTTMSILTGLFPPTSGYATVYGNDIRSSMDLIRKSLGMCPQHNVLFDELTVHEHLWFYARLKGMHPTNIQKEMDKLIEDLGLPLKKHKMVDTLSGGMKRKVSIAIAFVGGSRTVILDEPTAGVDPYSRRAIWDLIIKYKPGRTILLSTHHMDEADMLGDRIAIMASGQLKCCGTSLYLKTNLGEGYHLYIVKKPDFVCDGEIDLAQSFFETKCSEAQVTKFITQIVVSAFLVSETKHELHYILPTKELKEGNFEILFKALDSNMDSLHLSSYGVKTTTLEEVFLKVAENTHANAENSNLESNITNQNSAYVISDKFVAENIRRNSVGASLNNEMNFDSVDLQEGNTFSVNDISFEGSNNNVMEMKSTCMSQWQSLARTQDVNCSSKSSSIHTIDTCLLLDDTNVEELAPQKDAFHRPFINEGAGSYKVEGKWLWLQQFWAIQVKRYYCTRRNWKGLFSQILLPAFFVSLAMSVALTAPKIEDSPPIILSPSQYYNYTQPRGNVVPFSNHKKDLLEPRAFHHADSRRLVETLHYPSGIGATCVLKFPHNSTFDISNVNLSVRNFELSSFFEPMCQSVFVPGLPLENFVPPAPTMKPIVSKYADENWEDLLNFTEYWALTSPPPITKERYYPICHCSSDKTGFVCPSYGYTDPEFFKVVTGDNLIDISGQNESEYFLYTTDMYRLRRYGALTFGLIRDFVPVNFAWNAPTIFRKIAVRHAAKIWYNHKGYHAMPTYVNTLNNAILRANLPPEKGNPAAYGITVINHPMTDTQTVFSKDQILQGTDVLISIFIIVAMSFVPASFVLFLVYERFTKAKHLQVVSGVHRIVYWIANYFWDVCNYTVPATCCVLILLIFDIPAYTSDNNFPAVVSLFLLYGWSITPMMYPASFLFKEPSSAYIFLIVINLFIGITCIVTSFLLEVFSYDKSLGHIHALLKSIFLVFPNYCLGRGLMDIAFNEYHNYFLLKTGQYHRMKSPFEWDLILRNLVAMAVCGITFFIITILCEFRFFIKPRRRCLPRKGLDINEDNDVNQERNRVLRGLAQNDIIQIERLTKIYHTNKLGQHLAVDELCLGIPEGECFGLLGVNGAGKTTTFKMLTGDTSVTGGDAVINGFSIRHQLPHAQQFIGYCPQFDALYDELTAREHLTLYARFRGIPRREEKKVVDWALKKLDLMTYADKPSGTYSGGNKRKLSTAIALLGGPLVILLDEPTTGMDPYSRRFLWDLIATLVHGGRSVVLTSHSMEECEALCTRLTIMVNGHFKCLGSIQHLKNKFGEGYSIIVRTTDGCSNAVERFFIRKFPKAILKERHHNILQYEIKSEDVSLAFVFSNMEAALKTLPIEDYTVSQNTLDNVFINFVKQQTEAQGDSMDADNPLSSSSVDMSNGDHFAVCEETEELIETSGVQLSFMPEAAR